MPKCPLYYILPPCAVQYTLFMYTVYYTVHCTLNAISYNSSTHCTVEGNTAASNAHKEKVGQVRFSLAPGSGVEILDLVVFPCPTLEEVFGVEPNCKAITPLLGAGRAPAIRDGGLQ